MALGSEKYLVVELPKLSSFAQGEFKSLPADPYCCHGQRFRRFSQYKMSFNGADWQLEVLPHRPFIQSKEYNPLVGGIARDLEPLSIDPTPQIGSGATDIGLATDQTYQVNVHQCRVVTTPEIQGVSVPEGPHRDGHEWGMVAVFGRHNIDGGETWLMPNDDDKPFFRTTLQPSQAIAYEDAAMRHFVTDITSATEGHRDLWIVAFNRWERRRYGEEFERTALQQ